MRILEPNRFLTLLKINRIGVHAPRLRNKKPGHDSAENIASKEDPKDVRDTNLCWATEVVEQHT